MTSQVTAPNTESALRSTAPWNGATWTQPKDRHQLLAEKLGITLRGPGDLPCLSCEHEFRGHAHEPGSTQAGICADCPCPAFVWDRVDEGPDDDWPDEGDYNPYEDPDNFDDRGDF